MSTHALRARLREKSGALAELKVKAFAAEAKPEDKEALKGLLAEIKAIEDDLDLAEATEATEAKHTRPAAAPVGQPATVPAVAAQPEVKELDQQIAIVAAGVIKAGKTGDPVQILKDEGYTGLVDKLLTDVNRSKMARGEKAVNTLVDAEGGVLVPTTMVGGIAPILRQQSTFLAANPTRVQLVSGRFSQPRGATGATAAYVAEGGLKPVSTPTFDDIDMRAKKLAGIVPMTNEARKWTVGNLEQYVREDLRNALALTMDLNAYLGTGAGASPLGILRKAGVQTYAPTFGTATAPTLAEVDALVNGMILMLTAVNIYNGGRWRWVMPYRTVMRLSTMRVGGTNGDLAFPELSGDAPRFRGIPVIVSSQIPTNGGGTTDETTIALVDFAHVLFGEEEAIVIKVSDQATLDTDGAGTLLHLFQQNMFAILAESEHDFGLRYAPAVVKATIRF